MKTSPPGWAARRSGLCCRDKYRYVKRPVARKEPATGRFLYIFTSCYSSTSERACDTLELVTGGKLPYTRLKGIKEWNFGRFEAMDDFLNPPVPYGDFFVKYGGESEKGVSERITKTLSDVMEQEDHHSVLAVSHGGALACFLRYNHLPFDHHIGNVPSSR